MKAFDPASDPSVSHLDSLLRDQSDFLRQLVDRVPGVLWATDADLRFTASTGAGLAAIQLRPGQLVGVSLLESCPADRPSSAPILAAHRRALGGESASYDAEYGGRFFQCHLHPLRGADGGVSGCLGIAFDVTDHKLSEAAVRASEERYRRLVELSPDAVFIHQDAKITFANSAALKLVGATAAEQVVGRSVLDLVHPDYRELVRQRWGQMTDGANGVPFVEEKLLRLDDTAVDVEVAAVPFVHNGRPAVLAIARDLTARLVLEAQVRQAQKMDAIGQLAGGVAHDFNNLLTIISGYSEMLLEQLHPDAPELELVRGIHEAGERAARLTRQLLLFSRKQPQEPKVLDLNAVVTQTETLLRRLLGEDVTLGTNLARDLGRVKMDPGQVEQIILNLTVNARDAMPRGGKLTLATANVNLDEKDAAAQADVGPGRFIRLTVSDTGCGMAAETRARIFEPFFTTKGPGKGTGLGLATVHGIIKTLGGHIQVFTEEGRGTTFHVYVPRYREDVPTAKAHPGLRASPRGTETILLVEDEEAVRTMTRFALRTFGYTVLDAARPDEALRITAFHDGPIHLLVTDVVMPGMDGRQLAERLRASIPTLKVLYLSGYTDDAVSRHGVVENDTHFLQKPYTPGALAQKVRELLDGAEKRQK